MALNLVKFNVVSMVKSTRRSADVLRNSNENFVFDLCAYYKYNLNVTRIHNVKVIDSFTNRNADITFVVREALHNNESHAKMQVMIVVRETLHNNESHAKMQVMIVIACITYTPTYTTSRSARYNISGPTTTYVYCSQ
jgi:hypothetical protein